MPYLQADDPIVRRTIVEAGGARLCAESLEKHMVLATPTEDACGALQSLAGGPMSLHLTSIAETGGSSVCLCLTELYSLDVYPIHVIGAIPILARAITTHLNNKRIVYLACLALLKLSGDSATSAEVARTPDVLATARAAALVHDPLSKTGGAVARLVTRISGLTSS